MSTKLSISLFNNNIYGKLVIHIASVIQYMPENRKI